MRCAAIVTPVHTPIEAYGNAKRSIVVEEPSGIVLRGILRRTEIERIRAKHAPMRHRPHCCSFVNFATQKFCFAAFAD